MKEIIFFLKTGVVSKTNSVSKYFRVILFLVLITSFFQILVTIIAEILKFYGAIQKAEHISVYDSHESHKLWRWLNLVLLAPILEELTFRFPLIDNKFSLPLFISLLFLICFDFSFFYSLAFFLGGIFLLLSLYKMCSKLRIYQSVFYRKNHLGVIYTLAFLFGGIHLFNFTTNSLGILSSLIIILPHFFAGLMFSFIRLKFSLMHSIFAHSLWNSLIFSVIYFLNL